MQGPRRGPDIVRVDQAEILAHLIIVYLPEKDELETKMAYTETETGELNQLRLTVATVKSHLKDYITLESTGIVLLTTTGQVRWMIIL